MTVNNVEDKTHPFKWEGNVYNLKYTIYSEIKLRELYPAGIVELANKLKSAESNQGTAIMMLLEIFAIALNQQIKIRNHEQHTNISTVDAEYLLMTCDNTTIAEMMQLTYKLLSDTFYNTHQANSAEKELDEIAENEFDKSMEEDEKN